MKTTCTLLFILALMVTGCDQTATVNLSGKWEGIDPENFKHYMEIKKEGTVYVIDYYYLNRAMNYRIDGKQKFSGELKDNKITTGLPMGTDITYSPKSNKLFFNGAEYRKID